MGKGRAGEKLKRKVYEKQSHKLHAELVTCRNGEAQGAEGVHRVRGSDGAGKVGDKAITERWPRVFRVVALPAPTEREKTPAAGEGEAAGAAEAGDPAPPP